MRYRGFTLVEAIVIIIILVMLAAVLSPFIFRRHRGARQDTCTNNQRQLGIAIMMYVQDHDERYFPDPTTTAWSTVFAKYDDGRLFDCPTRTGKGTSDAPEYGFNACLYSHSADMDNPMATIVTADLATSGKAQNYSFTKDVTAPGYYGTAIDLRHMHGFVYCAADGSAGYLPVPEGTIITDAVKKAGMQFAVKVKTP